jgi:release factor glutamine methyltransferase
MLTTTTLLDYIKNLAIAQKAVLELGAGNGLIALWCARAGAQVTASDINPAAIRSIKESAQTNDIELTTILSDLFTDIPVQQFDYIFINPPYFPKNPGDDQERAFFCGENFEYFHALFQQLAAYTHRQSTVLMILTDDCQLEQIATIAQGYDWQWKLTQQSKKMGEQHLIYQLFSSGEENT